VNLCIATYVDDVLQNKMKLYKTRFSVKSVNDYATRNGIDFIKSFGEFGCHVYSDGTMYIPNNQKHIDTAKEICKTMKNL
jgi:hypothetical protein